MERSIVLQLHPRPEIWPIGWLGGDGVQPLFFVPPAEEGKKKEKAGVSHLRGALRQQREDWRKPPSAGLREIDG
jgi:hypothetical protein